MNNIKRFLVISALVINPITTLANAVGADTQSFNPTTSGIDFVTVHSSETLNPGLLNFGVYLNYAVNSLPNFVNTTTQSRTTFKDQLLSSDLNIGFGLTNNWDMGISFPQVHRQEVESNVTRGEFSSPGITEIRINSKYRLFGDQSGGLAIIASVNIDQIEDNPFTGKGADPTTNLEFAYDWTIEKMAMAANLGYRFRSPGVATTNTLIEPFDDQVIASVAISYLPSNLDTKLIGEIYSSFPTKQTDFSSDRDISSMELLLGVKQNYSHQLALHLGGGTELYQGAASPDWRLYAGFNWQMGPVYKKDTRAIVPKSDYMAGINQLDRIKPVESTTKGDLTIERYVGKDMLFEFNSSNINNAFQEELIQFGKALLANPEFKSLIIEGHTDSVGPTSYNQKLSERRATSALKALTAGAHFPEEKISIKGYGETKPIADNGNYQGRAINRRVEFVITKKTK